MNKNHRDLRLYLIVLFFVMIALWLSYFFARALIFWHIPTVISWLTSICFNLFLCVIIIRKPIPIRVYTIGYMYFLVSSLFYELVFGVLTLSSLRKCGVLPIATSLGLLFYGWLHGKKTVIREVSLNSAIHIPLARLRFALISDIHLGLAVTTDKLRKDIDLLINKAPDFLVIAGDLVDDQTTEAEMYEACEILGAAVSHFPVFFVYGNHDMASHGPKLAFSPEVYLNCLEKNGITVLNDRMIEWNGIYIIGRLDRGMRGEIKRKSLEKLLPDKNHPFIVIDHQPSAAKEAVSMEALLQLSGHTHGGQVWPANVLMKLTSKNYPSYGWTLMKNTWLVTSCGLGTRGSTLRSGTTAEMLLITLSDQSHMFIPETQGRGKDHVLILED